MTAVSPAIVAVAALLAGGAVLAFGRSPWTAPATGPWAVAGGAIVVAGHLVFGLTLAAVCARLARWRRALGHAGVLVVAVLAAWAGTVVLLSAVVVG